MDNGHKGAIFSSNPEMGNDLNTENWQESLKEATPAGMPAPEELSAKEDIATTEDAGLYSAEEPLTPDTKTHLAEGDPYELGQITPVDQPQMPKTTADITPQKYNPVNIRTTGDKLEKSTIPEIDNIITELNQTGNLNNFYDEIRGTDEKPGMMEINLKNSYNRQLGEREAS